jgi:hypothetical protein
VSDDSEINQVLNEDADDQDNDIDVVDLDGVKRNWFFPSQKKKFIVKLPGIKT